MSNSQLNIMIEEPQWMTALPDVEELAPKILTTVLDYVSTQQQIDFLDSGKTLAINLALGNDAEVQELNREFRGFDKPTNVLSFANIDDPSFQEEIATADLIELGDIIIALETLQREADLKSITLHNHFCHLCTHGILHLLGYDHQEDSEAEQMEALEVAALQQLNIPNPYQE